MVLVPTLHDAPNEDRDAYGVTDWKRAECDLVPGRGRAEHGGVRAGYIPESLAQEVHLAPAPLLDNQGAAAAGHGRGTRPTRWNSSARLPIRGVATGTGVSQGRPAKLDGRSTAREA